MRILLYCDAAWCRCFSVVTQYNYFCIPGFSIISVLFKQYRSNIWSFSNFTQDCIYLSKIRGKYSKTVKDYYNLKPFFLFSIWIYMKIQFIPMIQSWIFSSYLESSIFYLVLHDHSEIIQICWFAAQEIFLDFHKNIKQRKLSWWNSSFQSKEYILWIFKNKTNCNNIW